MKTAELHLYQELDVNPISVDALEQQAGHTSDAYPEGSFNVSLDYNSEHVDAEAPEKTDEPELQGAEPNEDELLLSPERADWPLDKRTVALAYEEKDRREAEDKTENVATSATVALEGAAAKLDRATASIDERINQGVTSAVEKKLSEANVGNVDSGAVQEATSRAVQATVPEIFRAAAERTTSDLVIDKLDQASNATAEKTTVQVEAVAADLKRTVDAKLPEQEQPQGTAKTVKDFVEDKGLALAGAISGLSAPVAIALEKHDPVIATGATPIAIAAVAHIVNKLRSRRERKEEHTRQTNILNNVVRLAMGQVKIDMPSPEETEE